MSAQLVTFIAFEEFDNLGIGYMASVLTDAGYNIEVIDIRQRKKEILDVIKSTDPLIIGFSVIFQNHINDFAELVRYLRKAGVICHFTAGGQYASLRFNDLFKIIPDLDSVVRFDGEYPLLELVNCLAAGTDWRNVLSIVYKTENGLKINNLRRLERDLDIYPFPMRSPLQEYALGKKFAMITAGRGCYNNCKFCSVREYHKQAGGPFKRERKPEKVAEEMEMLFQQKGCSVYLFQDDDFPLSQDRKKDWIRKFCRELKERGLSDSILWKINCRPDEVEYKRFRLMKKHGLNSVFLGIEDGTDTGLKLANKNCTPSKIIAAIATLKKLNLGLDYGFLPFHPYSSFASVRENFKFLREMTGDGYSGVTFMKMMPYHATPIEEILRKEGRLKTIDGLSDYDFIDESLNRYYQLIINLFSFWMWHTNGFLNSSKWVRNYLQVYSKYYGTTPLVSNLILSLRETVAKSNSFMLDMLDQLSIEFETGKPSNSTDPRRLKRIVNSHHNEFLKNIKTIPSKLKLLEKFQQLRGFSQEHFS